MNKNHALLPLSLLMGLASAGPVQAATDVLAAYALYTQNQDSGETISLARFILDGVDQACPEVPSVTSMQLRNNPDPVHFPVTVCEGIYDSATAVKVPGSSLTLPAIKAHPANVVVFGDTGYKQKQVDEGTWVFPQLAAQAAEGSPDLVLNMGDYNYSGTPGTISVNGETVQVYDAGDNTTQGMCRIPGGYYGQNSPGSSNPDTWAAWQSNFFDAAQGLLSTAPFVFLRGNHELCARAGTGWFYLLDSNSPLIGKWAQQLSCPPATNPMPQVFSAPYRVSLDGVNMLVMDSTNACDSGRLYENEYVNQFNMMNELLKRAPASEQNWLLSHRPLWGIAGPDAVGSCGPDSDEYCIITQTLLDADDQTGLSAHLDLVVSGHMHRFQVVNFKSNTHAQQIISGNGGVKLESLHPKTTTSMQIDGHTATVMGVKQFGYMTLTLEGADWSGSLMGVNTETLLSCDSGNYPMCKE